ncbi:hypothetical protein GCM10017774_66450 [Lentzea cavernae]|uniref:Uncharacterized protein n=1 Tax=Lentzea cavernae TaxID=2020703 RepID=A0ABQ3MQN8_9PSEU|nr:hypothetical protein GCM10017774_66450 [Lentzea cavernae]
MWEESLSGPNVRVSIRPRTARDFPGASGRLTADWAGAGGARGAGSADALVVGWIIKPGNGFRMARDASFRGS